MTEDHKSVWPRGQGHFVPFLALSGERSLEAWRLMTFEEAKADLLARIEARRPAPPSPSWGRY